MKTRQLPPLMLISSINFPSKSEKLPKQCLICYANLFPNHFLSDGVIYKTFHYLHLVVDVFDTKCTLKGNPFLIYFCYVPPPQNVYITTRFYGGDFFCSLYLFNPGCWCHLNPQSVSAAGRIFYCKPLFWHICCRGELEHGHPFSHDIFHQKRRKFRSVVP